MQNGLFEQGTAARGHFGSSTNAAADGQTGWGATNVGSSVSQEFQFAEDDQPMSRISQIAGSSVGSFGAGQSIGARLAKGLILCVFFAAVVFFGYKMLLESKTLNESIDDLLSVFGFNGSGLLTTEVNPVLPTKPVVPPPSQVVVDSAVSDNSYIKPADSQTVFKSPYSSIPHEGFYKESISTQLLSSEQENSFRERLESPVYYQRYSVPQDIAALKRGGTEEILKNALANGKFWMRMHAVMGLADSGYEVAAEDVETALGSSHSELRARFFERFTGSRPCLDGCLFVIRESLKFLDARGRIYALKVVFQVDSPTHRDFAVAATFDQDATVRGIAREFLLKYPIDPDRWQTLYLAMAQAEPMPSVQNSQEATQVNDSNSMLAIEKSSTLEGSQPEPGLLNPLESKPATTKLASVPDIQSFNNPAKSPVKSLRKEKPQAKTGLSAKMIDSKTVRPNTTLEGIDQKNTDAKETAKPNPAKQKLKTTKGHKQSTSSQSIVVVNGETDSGSVIDRPVLVGVLAAWFLLQVLLIPAFVKAGEPWWSALVPVYSVICMARIAQLPAIYGLLFQIPPFWPVLLFLMLKSFKLDNLQALISLLLLPVGLLYVGLSPSIRHLSRTRYELEMMIAKSPGEGGQARFIRNVQQASGFERQNVHIGVHQSPMAQAQDMPTSPFQMPMSQVQNNVQENLRNQSPKLSISFESPGIQNPATPGQTQLSDGHQHLGNQVSPASALQDAALDLGKEGDRKNLDQSEPIVLKKTVTFAL